MFKSALVAPAAVAVAVVKAHSCLGVMDGLELRLALRRVLFRIAYNQQ